jgi:hypothetical protein
MTEVKLARVVYRMMKYGVDYVDKGMAAYESKYRQQQTANEVARKTGCFTQSATYSCRGGTG